MLVTYSSVVAILATMAVAVPLNINLGAYSPALVVGDGEISFAAGAATAAGLVSTLQGASQAETGAVKQGNAIAPAERAAILSEPASLPIPGVNKEVVKTNKVKRQNAGFDRALRFAEVALEKGPKIQMGTEEAGVGIIVENNPIAAAAPNKVVE